MPEGLRRLLLDRGIHNARKKHRIASTCNCEQKWAIQGEVNIFICRYTPATACATGTGATAAGAGIVIEKAYQHGGEIVRAQGLRVESLARIASMDEDGVKFVREE